MIDTIILTISRDKVKALSNGKDIPTWDLHSRTFNYEKYVKNPPKPLSKFEYRPKLTGIKRRITKGEFNSFLKIEFSVPKLLFGNNLNEITERDFEMVIDTLHKRLMDAGLIIEKPDLKNASVSALHVGKNIILSDGYTATFALKELSKISINKKFALTKTSFRNGGKSLQGHTLAHQIVFYDKIADLAQPKKKAIDNDQTPQQLSLFQTIQTQYPTLQILRMEIRLAQKQKMKAVLKKLGYPVNPTFAEVFKGDLWQKVIKQYWENMIEKENLFLFSLGRNPKKLLHQVLRTNPKIRPKEIVYLVGLDVLCRDEGGIRELRTMLESRLTQRGWYRINDDIKTIDSLTEKSDCHGWVKQIVDQIEEFKPFKLST